jgi:hypothetical protein
MGVSGRGTKRDGRSLSILAAQRASSPLKKCGCHVPRLPWACEFPRNHAHGKRGHGTLNRNPVFFNGLLVWRSRNRHALPTCLFRSPVSVRKVVLPRFSRSDRGGKEGEDSAARGNWEVLDTEQPRKKRVESGLSLLRKREGRDCQRPRFRKVAELPDQRVTDVRSQAADWRRECAA